MNQTYDGQTSFQKEIVKLGFPIFLGMISSVACQIVNAFWLARLSPGAIAGAATASFGENVLVGIILIVTTGITVLMSNRMGQNKLSEVRSYFLTGWYLYGLISIIVATTGYFFRREIAALLLSENSVSIIDNTAAYFQVLFPGVFMLFGQFMVDSIFNSNQDTKTPMKAAIITNIVNLCLDPILIYGLLGIPKLGVAGAALSTLIGRSIAFAWSTNRYLRSPLRAKLDQSKQEFNVFKSASDIIKIGFPLSVDFILRMIGSVILIRIISNFGEIQVAAYGISTRVIIIVTSAFYAIRNASSILTARRNGEGFPLDTKIIGRDSIISGLTVALFSLVVLTGAGKYIAQMFTSDQDLVKACTLVLFYLSIYLIPLSCSLSLGGSFMGSENGNLLLITTIVGVFSMVGGAQVISNQIHNVTGVWIGMIGALTLQSGTMGIMFQKIIIPKISRQVTAKKADSAVL